MHDSPRAADPAAVPTSAVLYEERLHPSLWIWLIAVMISSLSILVFVPIGVEIGLIAAVVVFAVIALLLTVSTPRIVVTAEHLQVGRAGIERSHVGAVTGYRGDDATHQRGPALHGLAFLSLRGWIDPVVRIQIEDRQDRTPYWLTSTRNPEALVKVLGGAMARDETQDQGTPEDPEA